jgi:hypothetical protein
VVGSELPYTRKRAGSQSSDKERSRERARTEKSLSTQVTAADFRRVHLIRRIADISELSPSPSRLYELEDPLSNSNYMLYSKPFTRAYNLHVAPESLPGNVHKEQDLGEHDSISGR